MDKLVGSKTTACCAYFSTIEGVMKAKTIIRAATTHSSSNASKLGHLRDEALPLPPSRLLKARSRPDALCSRVGWLWSVAPCDDSRSSSGVRSDDGSASTSASRTGSRPRVASSEALEAIVVLQMVVQVVSRYAVIQESSI
jgi:hypothetical protein